MKPTVILTHAAFASPSSWKQVALRLQDAGYPVVVPELPLTSLSDDNAVLKREIGRVVGPVVLAAHSYGGAAITAASAGEARIEALVYIAAMAPDRHETVLQLLHRAEPHPMAPQLVPDDRGFIAMSVEGFANALAPDSTREEIEEMVRTQKPISVAAITEPMGEPGWREKPSWYLVAEKDRVIAPETQRFFAERMRARVVSKLVDHTPLSSAPHAVVEAIQQAAAAVEEKDARASQP